MVFLRRWEGLSPRPVQSVNRRVTGRGGARPWPLMALVAALSLLLARLSAGFRRRRAFSRLPVGRRAARRPLVAAQARLALWLSPGNAALARLRSAHLAGGRQAYCYAWPSSRWPFMLVSLESFATARRLRQAPADTLYAESQSPIVLDPILPRAARRFSAGGFRLSASCASACAPARMSVASTSMPWATPHPRRA
jgi:hypothetical protein